jgi:protease I
MPSEMRGSSLRSGTPRLHGRFEARFSRRFAVADLSDVRVLMIATNGFENDELFKPRQALIDAGARVTLASISTDPIQGEKGGEKADTITPDIALGDIDTEEFDALVIPGGVANPDKLRTQGRAVQIVEEFMDDGKIVAAICHGPWLLVEADVVDGRKMTGWPSIRTDLENAGAEVVDQEVVVDGKLITSRKPDDIPAFNRAIVEALQEEFAEA